MAIHRTKKTRPGKPYPGFPLTPHPSGRWCKKIRGRLWYFGKLDDWQAALALYEEQAPDLHAGRKPRPKRSGLSVRYLCNHFLTAKLRKVEAGEMQRRTWLEYEATIKEMLQTIDGDRPVNDLASDDFGELRAALAKTRGPEALGNQIQRLRCAFKYAYDAGLVDRPVRYGPEFRRPGKVARRKARQAKPPRLFTAVEIRHMLAEASTQLKAMILLGINAGLGNSDCSDLRTKHIDLDRGILDFPRPKTAIERRATLWPETVEAVRAVQAVRPDPKDPADVDRVFLTKYGQPWVKFRDKGNVNAVTTEFNKVLRALKIDRDGVSFYALRHTFESIGGETGDQPAVDRIMGHEAPGMASVYREWVKDARENQRLRRVTDHVRRWLFVNARKG